MKSLRTSLGLTTLIGLSLTLTPGAFAVDAAVDTTTPIGAYWEQHQDVLGAATGEQQVFANGATQQTFENGVVTQGKYGGVQAVTGAAGAAFLKAGGAEKFGNAESSPWKHSHCGLSLTTHDGKTRWLVVLDEKTQAGSYLNLNSAEAKAWQAERSKTRSCFTNNAVAPAAPVVYGAQPEPVVAEGPAPLAEGVTPVEPVAEGIIPPVEPVAEGIAPPVEPVAEGVTPPVVAAEPEAPVAPEVPAEPETPVAPEAPADTNFGDAANKIAEARALALAEGVVVAENGGELTKVTSDLVTLNFGGNISAIYSISQDRALMINTDALAIYLANPGEYGTYLYQNEYTKHWKTGALELRALFYNTTAEQCSTPVTWDDHGYALFSSGTAVISHYFIQYNDYGTCINWDNQTVASPVTWGAGLMDRTATGTEIDATYDWSAAKFIPLQQVLELRLDANKVVYIKADANGKPLAGAQPVESSALTEALNLADRGRFSSYNDWAAGGDWNIWNEMTMLGAPIADATEVTVNGTTTVTQQFEGGTLIWAKGSIFMKAELNDLGKAKLAWYNDLGL
ncbi:hypothetical protein [Rothia sp. 32237D007AR]